MFSSDYPHPEGTEDPVGRSGEDFLAGLTEAEKTPFYSKNFDEMDRIVVIP